MKEIVLKFIESENHSAVESVSAERADDQDDHQDTLWLFWEAPLIRGEEEGGLLGSERMVVVIVMMMMMMLIMIMITMVIKMMITMRSLMREEAEKRLLLAVEVSEDWIVDRGLDRIVDPPQAFLSSIQRSGSTCSTSSTRY